MNHDIKKLELSFEGQTLSGIHIGGVQFNGYAGSVTVPDGVEWSQSVKSIKGGLSWRFHLRETAGKPLRSGFLKVKIPYSNPPCQLMTWAANKRFPEPLCDLGGLNLYYGGVSNGTVIPLVCLYDQKRNIGLTIAKPLKRTGGRFFFHFGADPEEGMEVVFSDFALKPGAEIQLELLLCGHVGCWRPGLRWFADCYPDYFLPPNPKAWKYHGPFAITSPFSTPETVKRLEAHGVRWSELHNHFPNYGNYAPEVPDWESVVLHDYPDLKGEIPSRISPELIHQQIWRLHESNILAMMYIQCTGDGFIPWAEKYFPDAIARDSAGKPFPTWRECCLLNADPSTQFGKFMNDQIDRFLERYSEMDGVFIDQLCYHAIDYAHSDGYTCVDGRPAYQLGISYEHGIQKVTTAIHAAHKLVWGNGPFDMEIAKYIDGMMCEGTTGFSQGQKYLCIRKPRLVHTYPTDSFKAEAMLRYCLLAGAAWSVGGSSTLRNPPVQTPAIRQLFAEYTPLIEPLLQTEFCLEANPVSLPLGYEYEVFRSLQTDNYFFAFLGNSSVETLEVTVNLPHGRTARCRGNKDSAWQELPFDGDLLRIPNTSAAYVVEVKE
ncbi:MAG: hypothetical protein IKP00_01070 [Victivallales bacterium]|nr:hypothetical protein [Victivallales bacterium]